MKNLSSWLLTIFMFMFWAFRVIIAFYAQYGKNFGGFGAFDLTTEIVLLFITVFCFILILRRFLLGAIMYLAGYGWYFGMYIINNVIINNGLSDITIMQNVLVSALAVLLAFCMFVDLAIEKIRKKEPKETKTDWFFNEEKYDRKLDERADKNQYRNY